ncbi:uncharacterized protein LOC105697806 isoform X2 [Orussus abietinus]|uniref:uncharacterized protein LOC105697806 isoform X2 n=1 Tax=Orussus abietinus TaxID=222816 RepID=UPI0006254F03|nr:uncharacterized protein LOC105697806 isoform X2 [Orussus abietinus]
MNDQATQTEENPEGNVKISQPFQPCIPLRDRSRPRRTTRKKHSQVEEGYLNFGQMEEEVNTTVQKILEERQTIDTSVNTNAPKKTRRIYIKFMPKEVKPRIMPIVTRPIIGLKSWTTHRPIANPETDNKTEKTTDLSIVHTTVRSYHRTLVKAPQ